MSGHSKWSSIKHKKGAADAKRGKLFSKLARAIIVAAREGGPDPAANLATAQLAAEALDVVLAGNHEWRLLECPDDNAPALEVLAERGWPQAAAATRDGWLITHAGVHPKLARDLPADAHECAKEINRR